jgi:hypothetical protein
MGNTDLSTPGRIAMDPVAFCVASLATWRLAHFLHAEDGPWHAAARLRRVLGSRRVGVLDCFFCVSVWTALPAALLAGTSRRQVLLLWPALSAGAILLEHAAFPATFVDVPEYFEERQKDVLRQD